MMLSDTTEQAFLGCLIRAPEIYKIPALSITKNYFNSLKSQKLYEIIGAWLNFYQDDKNISDTEFLTFIESQYGEWFKRNSGFVGECFKLIPDKDVAIEKWHMHFSGLQKFLYYREFKELLLETDKKVDEDPLNIEAHIHNAVNNLTSTFSNIKDFQKQTMLGDVIDNFQANFMERMNPDFSPSKFDFFQLDNLLGGYFPGSYNLITARSSVGKSAFINTISRNMIYNQGKKIAVFNLETGNFPFLMRWFAKDLEIDSKFIREPQKMTDEQRISVMEASKKLMENFHNKLFLVEGIYYVDQIIQKILYLDKIYGLDGIFIDLLEYVRCREHTENRQKEIAFISNEFFNLTRANRFWIAMIQQQNKEGDKKGEQAAGRNAEDTFLQADTVIGLYHSELENGEKDPYHRLVKVTKGRDSGVGSVTLKYTGKFTLFEDETIGGETIT
jgi:replicative DNA helicase